MSDPLQGLEARYRAVSEGVRRGAPRPGSPLPPELAPLLADDEPFTELSLDEAGMTPIPELLEALPDLPEYLESARDAEALEELLALTSRLRGDDAEEEDDSGPGVAYGSYRLIEKVATGGMAEIFRAARRGVDGFEKTVAVKRILPHLSDNREFVTMFVDEAKTVAQLAHPNIVTLYDLGRIRGNYYIAMEYVHGRDLRSILRRGRERELPMPRPLAVLIAARLCAGLGYAHRRRDERGRPMQIVHRDVSPQNVLISFEGDVKLTDFGIATVAHKASVTERGMLRGKITYMSPEQTLGVPVDNRSDLFSLGVMLYEMVTGQRPLGSPGQSDASLLEAIRECRITPPRDLVPELPGSLVRVIDRALARDPDDRYPDAETMGRDLEAILRDELPGDSSDLAEYLESLFDPAERTDPLADEGLTQPRSLLGVMRPLGQERAAQAPVWQPPTAMSLSRLLERFDERS